MNALRMVLLGRQGSGKGTQSVRIAAGYGCVHISTGDMLRAAVAEGTALGRQASDVMESGGLVSDDIMNSIVAARVARADITAAGVLLDGFPRTADQADALQRILAGLGQSLTVALNLEVPAEIATERMRARRRDDDTPEAMELRLRLYEEQTAPLLDWFDERDLLTTVDGVGDEGDVFARIVSAIENSRS